MIRPVSAREDDEQLARQQKKRRADAAYRISGLVALQQRARQEWPSAVVALMQALDGSRSMRSAHTIAKSAHAAASDADRLQTATLRTAQSSGASSSVASRHAAALLASRHADPALQRPIVRIKDPDADAVSQRVSPKAAPLQADDDAKPLLKTLWDDPEALTRPGRERQLDTVLREIGKLTDQLRQQQARANQAKANQVQANQVQANRDEAQLGTFAQQRQDKQDTARVRSEKSDHLQHQRQALPSRKQEQPRVVAPAEGDRADQVNDGSKAASQDALRRMADRKPRPAPKAGDDQRANARAASQASRVQDALAVAQKLQSDTAAKDLFTRGQLRYLIGFFEQEARANPRAAQLHGALALLDQEMATAPAAQAASEDRVAQSAIGIEEQSVAGSKAGKTPAEQSILQSWIDKLDQLARALAGASDSPDHAAAMQFLLAGQLLEMPVPSMATSGAKRMQDLKIAAGMVDRLMQMERLVEQHEQGEAVGKLKQSIFEQRQRWEKEIDDNAARADNPSPGQASQIPSPGHDDTFFHRQVGSL